MNGSKYEPRIQAKTPRKGSGTRQARGPRLLLPLPRRASGMNAFTPLKDARPRSCPHVCPHVQSLHCSEMLILCFSQSKTRSWGVSDKMGLSTGQPTPCRNDCGWQLSVHHMPLTSPPTEPTSFSLTNGTCLLTKRGEGSPPCRGTGPLLPFLTAVSCYKCSGDISVMKRCQGP